MRFHPIIRVISCVLILAFIFHDIAWSYPDTPQNISQKNSDTLAPETFLRKDASPENAVAKFVELAIEAAARQSDDPRNIVKSIGNILARYDKWLKADSVEYTISRNYGEVLLLFPAGNALRYYAPDVEARDRTGYAESAHQSIGCICKQALRPDKTGESAPTKLAVSDEPSVRKVAAIDPDKLRYASLTGLASVPMIIAAMFMLDVDPHSITAVFGYLTFAFLTFTPLLTSYFIKDALAFRHDRIDDGTAKESLSFRYVRKRDYGLIRPFRNVGRIRVLATVTDKDIRDDAEGKISLFSYAVEGMIERREMEEIDNALFIDEDAMKRVPRFFQWIIYFHEWIHSNKLWGKRLRLDLEAAAVPLTFCAPVFAVGSAYLSYISFGMAGDVLSAHVLYTISLLSFLLAAPVLSGTYAVLHGVVISPAGHKVIEEEIRKPLSDMEIDDAIAQHAYSVTLDEEGNMSGWREWLKGAGSSKVAELIKCPNRPEDILVVKSIYVPISEETARFLVSEISLSTKKSIVLIIADDGKTDSVTAVSRKDRVRLVVNNVNRAISAAGRTGGVCKGIRKTDVRSTRYDITRLRDLLMIYGRRLDRLVSGNIEREAVLPEVHGNVQKLKVVLDWLRRNGFRRAQFLGDYIGHVEDEYGLEAIDVLMDYISSGVYPRLSLLMGNTENVFIRAMMGDDSLTDKWLYNSPLGGTYVRRSLESLALRKIEPAMSSRMKEDIAQAAEFQEVLKNMSDRERISIDQAWRFWYRYHPKLLSVMDFIIEHMDFARSEDPHHNMHLPFPEDLEWRGLEGIEALRAMDTEFKDMAKIGLWELRLMKDMWMSMYVAGDTESTEAEKIRKARLIVKRERDVLKIEYGKVPARIFLEKQMVLNGIENVILENLGNMRAKDIMLRIEERLRAVTRPVPKILDEVLRGDSIFSMRDRSTHEGSADVRQRRRIQEGVNTIISSSKVDFTEGLQELGQIRALDRRGYLSLISVDALCEGRFESEAILVPRIEDEASVGRPSMTKAEFIAALMEAESGDNPASRQLSALLSAIDFSKAGYTDNAIGALEMYMDMMEMAGGGATELGAFIESIYVMGKSLEMITRKKLRMVEKIVDDYDHLLRGTAISSLGAKIKGAAFEEKPEAPNVSDSRGKRSSETKASEALKRFVDFYRDESKRLRDDIRSGRQSAIGLRVTRILNRLELEFASPGLSLYLDALTDCLNDVAAIRIFLDGGYTKPEIFLSALDRADAVLQKLEQSDAEGRLEEAIKAINESGHLDAFRRLESGKPEAPNAADADTALQKRYLDRSKLNTELPLFMATIEAILPVRERGLAHAIGLDEPVDLDEDMLVQMGVAWDDAVLLAGMANGEWAKLNSAQMLTVDGARRVLRVGYREVTISAGSKDYSDEWSGVHDGADSVNPVLRRHIDAGNAYEIRHDSIVIKIRRDRSNPRDPPAEMRLRSNGALAKIQDARNPALLRKIIERSSPDGSPNNFQNLTPDEQTALIEVVQKIPLSIIAGQSLIDHVGKEYCLFHIRTGHNKDNHHLYPTIWVGEVLLERLNVELLAQAMLEEAQHIVRPYKLVAGKWINLHWVEGENEDPLITVKHDKAWVRLIKRIALARPEELGVLVPEANEPISQKFAEVSKPEAPNVAATGSEVPVVVSEWAGRLAALDTLFRLGIDGKAIADGTSVLLSENLFVGKDGDRSMLVEMESAGLGFLFKETSPVRIMKPEEMRRMAMNRNITKDKMAVVFTKEDFENKSIWNGSDKETSVRASVLILDDKMTGNNYLYLEAVIGLGRAFMAGNRRAIGEYYRLISGVTIDDKVLQLLKDDDQNNMAFAIKAILKFKPIDMIANSEDFNRARISMENALISA